MVGLRNQNGPRTLNFEPLVLNEEAGICSYGMLKEVALRLALQVYTPLENSMAWCWSSIPMEEGYVLGCKADFCVPVPKLMFVGRKHKRFSERWKYRFQKPSCC